MSIAATDPAPENKKKPSLRVDTTTIDPDTIVIAGGLFRTTICIVCREHMSTFELTHADRGVAIQSHLVTCDACTSRVLRRTNRKFCPYCKKDVVGATRIYYE